MGFVWAWSWETCFSFIDFSFTVEAWFVAILPTMIESPRFWLMCKEREKKEKEEEEGGGGSKGGRTSLVCCVLVIQTTFCAAGSKSRKPNIDWVVNVVESCCVSNQSPRVLFPAGDIGGSFIKSLTLPEPSSLKLWDGLLGWTISLLPALWEKMDAPLSRPTSFCDDSAGLLAWFSPLPFSSGEVSKEECEELNAWKHERDDLGARNSSSLICRTLGFCPRTGTQNLNLALQREICISLRKVLLEDSVLLPCVY